MNKQSGFTLVEIAIVLVIIGLLLGGVLKGQELINSAKVKNFAQDFRNVPLFIYGYQDKFKALPGDHASAATAITGATNCTATANTCVPGNGVINGTWDAALANAATTETLMFWQHVRMAGFAAGPTTITDPEYRPKNADGGLIGIEAGSAAVGGAYIGANAAPVIAALTPTYLVCSQGILGKFAKQLDTMLDDGNTATGSVRVVAMNHARGGAALATAAVDDSTSFIVCMGL
ncbi:MAG: prepilin-type N-terminal cleavage/methylation domain-containing protein [Gammaproteobacteria bacterium]|nr:prepilin-type N-terminal cleavage/methylation domain-containing protein [Rhodocyclaceae bacterium]MBU3909461.1 prepilin-type N-terminal cleavage/methylation domain-containing protein [Gammaproteobacteria bacterium]MBU3988279.1 prepilin-type N-terminal cleavage/methylation domain-containing protein [Gammaproteobacteria bacterium]MBU4003639.1 prepilin-type N-terminal cleavage/methylation domain-containing protein [Gammaproteobacteria bacterium]MBU4021997.1 prepilin-type N-terminal cleavage/met